MKVLLQKLKRFFFPPEDASRWVKTLPYLVLGGLTLLLLIGAAYGWEYTNSPEFCGTACHTMPPEYTAYLISPHARIDCVDCHIGKGFIATRITRKAGDMKHVFATAFKTYEFPIRAHDLRPARETCELCHSPDKFSDDSLREIKRFSDDTANTPKSIYLVLKTGGGDERLGLGRGIHWHIMNKVEFLATDDSQQTIPYVRVTKNDGSIDEYVSIDADISPQSVSPDELFEMDCITCHNRITHLVPPPEDTVDRLMDNGIISQDIPDIHNKAIEVYSQIYETTGMGVNGIIGLTNYYTTYYPEYYQANQEKVDRAIDALVNAYQDSVFPEQNSDWSSHPNNVGHKETPGCFRCHDGKHLNAADEAIRLECNLCHSVPVVAGPDDLVADIEISRGPEPQTHLNANWIAQHHVAFDTTCENCHTTGDPGGVSNTSFCSNSACHGSVWEYAGFDAPGLREIVLQQLPPTPTPQPVPASGALNFIETIGPLFQARCGSCHGQDGIQGLDLTTYAEAMQSGASGPAIIPGDAEGSLLVQKQNQSQPHFGQFNAEELDLVIEWINAGAPEN
jgi:nitrate/TMAO reductase-like tetraheme cytochrome c subunit